AGLVDQDRREARGARAEYVDREDVADIDRARRRYAEARERAPEDLGVRLLDALDVRVDDRLEMRRETGGREQRRDAAVRVRDHAGAEAARAQPRERRLGAWHHDAPEVRAHMLGGELGGDRLRRGAREPGALEHRVEVARDAVGVAVAWTAGLRGAPVDLAPHR